MSAPVRVGTDAPARGWGETNSWDQPSWTVAELERAKAGRTVSVVLPALNEEKTVGAVVDTIHPLLGGLVDELIVLDSGSTDATAERARAAGAQVLTREEAVPGIEPVPGKGEVLALDAKMSFDDLGSWFFRVIDHGFRLFLLGVATTQDALHRHVEPRGESCDVVCVRFAGAVFDA